MVNFGKWLKFGSNLNIVSPVLQCFWLNSQKLITKQFVYSNLTRRDK